MFSRCRSVGPTRWLLVLAALLLLPAARFECRLGRAVAGTERGLSIRAVTVAPAELSLPAGGKAVLEGMALDELGGRVEVQLDWRVDDPSVATVAPRRATRTVVTARMPGETVVTATHVSGAADTVRVAVTPPPAP